MMAKFMGKMLDWVAVIGAIYVMAVVGFAIDAMDCHHTRRSCDDGSTRCMQK